MAVSQNGWSANDRSVITSYSIGNYTHVSLRKGAAGLLLQHFANWFDVNVQDIDGGQLDDWGYAERVIRGGVELSNHASGTALDLNATRWALGSPASRNLNAEQIVRVHGELARYQGAIRWGGDYTGRTDPMHFEINVSEAEANRVWALISGAPAPQGPAPAAQHPTLKRGSTGALVRALQVYFNANYPLYSKLAVDGVFGGKTEWVVQEFQRRSGLYADGIVGPRTWAKIAL